MTCKCNSTSICKDHITENVIARAEKANAETARTLEACIRLLGSIDARLAELNKSMEHHQ